MKFETFTRMKEDLRIKSKTSLEKTGYIETELVSFLSEIKQLFRLELLVRYHVRNHVQNHVQNHVRNNVPNHVQNHVQNRVQTRVQNHVRKIKI